MNIVDEDPDMAEDTFEAEIRSAFATGRNERTESHVAVLIRNHFGIPVDGLTTVEAPDRYIGILEVSPINEEIEVRARRLTRARFEVVELDDVDFDMRRVKREHGQGFIVKVRQAKAMLERVMRRLGIDATFYFPPYGLTPEQETVYRLNGCSALLTMVTK